MTTVYNSFTISLLIHNIDICKLEKDYGGGSGWSGESRFYYNDVTGHCTLFTYTGKGGNSNNFGTKKECEDRCGGM